MSVIRYVVASVPRSGTKYISSVLTKMGLACTHEKYFNTKVTEKAEAPTVFGDASWMAVPYIRNLPSGTIVLHQLRDPLKVLNSNLPPGGDSYFRTWDKNAGLSSDPLYNRPLLWKRFIWENTLDWVWPQGGGEQPEGPEEIQRLIHWWMNWNLWIEYAASKRADLQYVRYRVEDLDAITLEQFQILLDPTTPPDLERIKEVVEEVSTTTNRHREPNNRIAADMLPPAARLLLYRYGYSA